jgi:transcriptional regulator with XRE-family HTH domain
MDMTGPELRAARKRLALTQAQLAAAMNLDIATRQLGYYEAGEKPIPRVVELSMEALENQARRRGTK